MSASAATANSSICRHGLEAVEGEVGFEAKEISRAQALSATRSPNRPEGRKVSTKIKAMKAKMSA